jgi:hypothetical protein
MSRKTFFKWGQARHPVGHAPPADRLGHEQAPDRPTDIARAASDSAPLPCRASAAGGTTGHSATFVSPSSS